LLGSAAVLFCAVPASAQQDNWAPDKISSEWVGKKLLVRTANGQLMDLWFKSDGVIEIAGNNFTDTGVWRLNESGYCAKWQKIRSGQERCFTVRTELGQTVVFNPDGSPSGSILRSVAP
jgi:hypothetical protein